MLVSWAVPKGPTLDPAARRLAVHVEDHPLDYYDFEGVIAAGEYGGGDVIVWDWGTWELVEGDDPLAAIAAGDLHLALDGDKLRGRFALVRRGRDRGAREQWLLIKKRDDDAVDGWDPEDHPRSVKSGRTNDEVRDAPAASWSGSASWAGGDRRRARRARRPRGERARGRSVATRCASPASTTCASRRACAAGRGGRAVTRRDLVRHDAAHGPGPAALPRRAAARRRRASRRCRDEGRGARGPCPAAHRHGCARWSDGDVGAARAGLRGVARLVGELGRARAAPVDVDDRRSRPPDVGPSRHRRRRARRRCGAVVELARLHRTALEHLGLDGRPVLIGGRGHPDLGADRPAPRARAGATTGSRRSPGRSAHGARAGRRRHPAGSARAAPRRPVQRAAPHRARPVAVPLSWDELDDDVRASADGPIRDARRRACGSPATPSPR